MAEISKIQPFGSSTQYDLSALKIKVSSTSAPSSATTYRLMHCNATSGYTDVGVTNTLGLWRDSTSNYLVVGNNTALGGVTLQKGNGKYVDLVPGALTANRTITFPDESGTVAIANSANSGYVRKTGDTMTGSLYWGSNGAGGYLNGSATDGGKNSILIGNDAWLGDCDNGGIIAVRGNTSNI